MAIRAIIGLFMIIMMAGCSPFGNQGNDADAFVTEILRSYPELADKQYEIATVARTVDGDTFATETGEKVRLIGMDTPESTKEVELFGKEASSFSRERLTGKKVYMFRDTGDQDRYGRLLRYIFVENEPIMFNETLLVEGYANTMTVPPNVMFSEKFVRLEREARASGKGLWGATTNETPISNQCAEPKIKGNINSRNEKIYHIPGGRYYDQTKAEELFCTEEEAVAAGFRKSKN